MPTRMLRDWTDSDRINSLSVHSERFFTRLIMKADDYGCFHADYRLLKANLFPLLLDTIREADITRWMAECQKAGLIVLYQVEGKRYLQIKDFKQRLDKARNKFPLPVNDFPESVNDFPPERETEYEVETEVEKRESADKPRRAPFEKPTVQELLDFFAAQGLDLKTASTEAAQFVNYYESNGWHVGKNKMQNWRAAAQGWKNRIKNFANAKSTNGNSRTAGASTFLATAKSKFES